MASAYFAPLVTLPHVIDAPGQYLTRCGEIVTVVQTSVRNDFGCVGSYENGVRERWHRSGRIFAGQETDNDIVGSSDKLVEKSPADEAVVYERPRG